MARNRWLRNDVASVGVAFVVACKYNRLALVETMLANETLCGRKTLAAVAKSKAQEGLFALVKREDGRADEAVVRVLLSTGAVGVNVPEWRNSENGGALHFAAMQGHANVVEVLIEAKADVNQTKQSDGTTPLYWAAQNGQADVVSRPLSIVSAVSIVSRSIHALDFLGLTVSLPYALGSTLQGRAADRGQG
jgi:hypothetical protein